MCPLTTADALARAAAIAPDVEAIVASDGRLTYAELETEVAALRGCLAAAGIGKGDHVGLCMGNGARWMALFLALGSVGAVTVPVNTRFRGEEMAYALRQSRVSTLFIVDRFLRVELHRHAARHLPWRGHGAARPRAARSGTACGGRRRRAPRPPCRSRRSGPLPLVRRSLPARRTTCC